MFSGITSPDDSLFVEQKDPILVYLANGDVIRPTDMSLMDDSFGFTTGFGLLRVPISSVVMVRTKPGPRPAMDPKASWIEAGQSRFPIQISAITRDQVVGNAGDLGKVTLGRTYVQRITFGGMPKPKVIEGAGPPPPTPEPGDPVHRRGMIIQAPVWMD